MKPQLRDFASRKTMFVLGQPIVVRIAGQADQSVSGIWSTVTNREPDGFGFLENRRTIRIRRDDLANRDLPLGATIVEPGGAEWTTDSVADDDGVEVTMFVVPANDAAKLTSAPGTG